ncbi:MAG: ABC transporter permease [Oligoflexia bacterium]|nr:ABC transporter permease [Oligoflexia bacterium]
MSGLRTALASGTRQVGAFSWFVLDFTRAALRYGPPRGQVMREAWRIGIASLPILLTISAFVGTNLALQGFNAFRPLGGGRLVGMFVSLAGVRELAPMIAAAMVAAKAGTEMASQIAVMRIGEQVDALEVMAVNPYAYLVTPRLLGILLVLPALTIISIFFMVLSGYLVSVHQLGLNGSVFLHFASQGIAAVDFLYGALKAMYFGLVICTVSCFFGFTCQRGPEGVGQATNRAVVVSAVVCVCSNYFISEILYGGLS